MLGESVLSQRLGQNIRGLILRVDVKDLDESITDVLAEMVVAHVDVLRARTELRQTS